MYRLLCLSIIALSGCASSEPGIEVRTVEVVRTVQAPCPGPRPERPEPLGPLPTDAVKLAAVLGAKLLEYAGPGMYADRADAIFDRCVTQ